MLGLHVHLNCVFAHLTLLNQRFNLIDPKETEILGDLEDALLGKSSVSPGRCEKSTFYFSFLFKRRVPVSVRLDFSIFYYRDRGGGHESGNVVTLEKDRGMTTKIILWRRIF